MKRLLIGLALVTASALVPGAAHGIVGGEPGNCEPACRAGFACRAGKCISLCNPPCNPGERCVKNECELMPRPGGAPPPRHNFLALMGVAHIALNTCNLTPAGSTRTIDSNRTRGEVRIEFGGRYTALQIGPVFAGDVTMLRVGILGYAPFRPSARIPLYLVPTVAIGYAFSWVKDPPDLHYQDIYIVPGLRLRYDLASRVAIFADLIQIEVNFLRLVSSATQDVTRADVVPVSWNMGLGVAFLY